MLEGVSLRKQLAVSFVAVAVVFGVTFGTIGVRWIETETAGRIVAVLNATASQGQATLDAALGEVTANVTIAASGMSGRTENGLVKAGTAWIEALRATKRLYVWAAMALPDGTVIASEPGGPPVGSSVAGQDWFNWSGRFATIHDVAGPESALGRTPSAIAAAPVTTADGHTIAVLLAAVGGDTLNRLIGLLTPRVAGQTPPDVFLVDGHGDILSSNVADRTLPLPPGLLDPLPGTVPPRDIAWRDGSFLTAVTSATSPPAGTGWRVVVRRPSNAAAATANAIKFRLLVADVVMVLLAAVIGMFLAHGISTPLHKIARAADRIRNGALDVAIPATSFTREIAMLARSLRSMVESLRANEEDLEGLNRELEGRVEQRTGELAAQERRLRTVIDTALDGVMIIDHLGRIEVFNPACERLYGWRRDEIIGREVGLIASDEFRAEVLAALDAATPSADGMIGLTREIEAPRRDGSTFHAQLSVSRNIRGDHRFHVVIVRDITEEVKAREELFAYATLDSLTGLRNRRHFLEGVETEFARARRLQRTLSFLAVDADHFKGVNDRYGHATGDAVLRTLADLCRRNVREVDLVGRLGGEEFAIAMPEAEIELAVRVAERLRSAVAESVVLVDGVEVTLTISVGVATLSDGDGTLAMLMSRADDALYEAKRTGRDKVVAAGTVKRRVAG